MKIMIEIDTETAAFEDNALSEMYRVMESATNLVADAMLCTEAESVKTPFIFDVNGNKVGKIQIKF